MVEVWRITAPEYAGDAYSGEGARQWGGRFNSPGKRVVYASGSLAGWDARPYTGASQAVGDAWLAEGRSLALRVPSVVVASEWNVLVNPQHPAFGEVEVSAPVAAPFDPRLLE